MRPDKRAFKINPAKVILWGGTGQAKVVRPIIEYYGAKVVAVFDDNLDLRPPFSDVPLYYGKKGFQKWLSSKKPNDFSFCIAIGNPHNRVKFHELLIKMGLKPATIVHPNVIIADNAVIGDGCQFMAGAIVNPQSVLGKQCIINTNASVDHECILGDGVELAPAATLCGQVKIGNNSWVCAGATVLPRIKIGKNVTVGAGALVNRDIPDGLTVVGVPAKRVLYRRKS